MLKSLLVLALVALILGLNLASVIRNKLCPTVNPVEGLHEAEMQNSRWQLVQHYPLTREDGGLTPSNCAVFYPVHFDFSAKVFEYFLDSLTLRNSTIFIRRRRSILRFTSPNSMQMKIQFFYDLEDEADAEILCNEPEKSAVDKIFWDYAEEIEFKVVAIDPLNLVAFSCLPVNLTHSKQSFLAFSSSAMLQGRLGSNAKVITALEIDDDLVIKYDKVYNACCRNMIDYCRTEQDIQHCFNS